MSDLAGKWTIVICCYNARERIRIPLASIREQMSELAPPAIKEVIIVDNNCTDDTVNLASTMTAQWKLPLLVVNEPKPGLTYARATGLAKCSTEFVCFLDDDNAMTPGYLKSAENALAQEGISFCNGVSRYPVQYGRMGILARYFSRSYAVGTPVIGGTQMLPFGRALWGAGLCIALRTYRRLVEDGFRPSLTGRTGRALVSGDDAELCLALQLYGQRGMFVKDMLIHHWVKPSRFTISYLAKLHYSFGLGGPAIKKYSNLTRIGERRIPSPESSNRVLREKMQKWEECTWYEVMAMIPLHFAFRLVFYWGYVAAALSRRRLENGTFESIANKGA